MTRAAKSPAKPPGLQKDAAQPAASSRLFSSIARFGPMASAAMPAASAPTIPPNSRADTTAAPCVSTVKPRSEATAASGVLRTPSW